MYDCDSCMHSGHLDACVIAPDELTLQWIPNPVHQIWPIFLHVQCRASKLYSSLTYKSSYGVAVPISAPEYVGVVPTISPFWVSKVGHFASYWCCTAVCHLFRPIDIFVHAMLAESGFVLPLWHVISADDLLAQHIEQISLRSETRGGSVFPPNINVPNFFVTEDLMQWLVLLVEG